MSEARCLGCGTEFSDPAAAARHHIDVEDAEAEWLLPSEWEVWSYSSLDEYFSDSLEEVPVTLIVEVTIEAATEDSARDQLEDKLGAYPYAIREVTT
jgi:hypothetical protein